MHAEIEDLAQRRTGALHQRQATDDSDVSHQHNLESVNPPAACFLHTTTADEYPPEYNQHGYRICGGDFVRFPCKSSPLALSVLIMCNSACICSIMRLEVSIRNESTSDWTHDWFPGFLWTYELLLVPLLFAALYIKLTYLPRSAEATSGIIASCLPTVSILLQRLTRGPQDPVSSCGNRSPSSVMETIDTTSPLRPSPLRKATESTPERCWESGDLERGCSSDHPYIFQGNSYTMREARAEGVSAERRRELDRVGNQEGILRIVEVDVQSRPGR